MEAAIRLDEASFDDGDRDAFRLEEILAEVAPLLPEQAPLHAFVHHNPLHAFEHLPFEEATVTAARLFGTEPFQTEEAFARCLENGRLRIRDLETTVEDCETDLDSTLAGGVSRRDFLVARLRHLFPVPSDAALAWMIEETDAVNRFHPLVSQRRREDLLDQARRRFGQIPADAMERRLCRLLWDALRDAAPRKQTHPAGIRPRDQIHEATGIDCDELVHPLLIRLCASFLDQGIAYWQLPGREAGFLAAFRSLYGLPGAPLDRWRRGLDAECRRQQALAWDAEQTVQWALESLGVAPAERRRVVRETLLSLPGWAGMMRQFELHPEQAPVVALPARLADYLAVQLVLDVFAARHARRTAAESPRRESTETAVHGRTPVDLALVYEAFAAAQLVPTDTTTLLDAEGAGAWLATVHAFDAFERRRLLHLAYERRHRVDVLDGLLANEKLLSRCPTPEFQAVFCIDDREESLRRHLEEIHPACETFGFAGFFGVAMVYQGIDDVRGRPLCPVAVKARHLIVERPVEPHLATSYYSARRWRGRLRNAVAVGSKSLVRGGLLTAAAGLASVVPLIGRCLFPRSAERLSHRMRHGRHHGPTTRLAIERAAADGPIDGLYHGYTTAEMADIVAALLRTTGLAEHCSPLVLVFGHGSSSLNNPHEAAHDCGATGGGRGGPNARAFAAMANHAAVRKLLGERGIAIPDRVWFVGAYHNTCDDALTYYDEDLVPAAARTLLGDAQRVLAAACLRDAHERCRRFGTSPLQLDLDEALAHAEAHAVDLAQPRPEYGHATNAVCIVGRRERTRGLFLDRRAFLVSYDPTTDADGSTLANLLLAVGPVGAGINLEYYFSFVDPTGYGCGTKLPHNIVGLFGVMDGHASDLRTGLPWQMVEIHEPVRLLLIVDAEPAVLLRILDAHPGLDRLVRNGWIQLVSWGSAASGSAMRVFAGGGFRDHRPECTDIPVFQQSREFYAGHREHLGCAHLTAAFGAAA